FMLIALIAVLTMIWISARVLWLKMTTQPLALAPVAPAASPTVSNSGVKSS
ncbi:MFS transporter, partial [Pseudomonas syringae]|nr:MFS transporter [Pseudomonas syringae]